MRGSTAMIEKERQSELIRKFVVSQEMPDDEIGDLSLDELTYIYFNTEIAKKDEKYKAIHFPIKQQIIYWGVVDAIKKAETLYVAFTERPKYPYLDPGRNVWLFSTEDNLTRALKKLEEDRGMHLIYQKLPNQVIVPFFAQLYYWGIEQVIVDNMNHPMIVKRSDVMPEMDQKKDEKKQDLCNKICDLIGHLQRAAKALRIHRKLDRILYQKLCLCCLSFVIFHDKCANALYQDQSWLFIMLCHKCIQRIFRLINIFHK